MSKTKNQIINEVIDATIARLTPADTPETISDEVTQDIEGLIVLENVARGKGCGLRVPEVLAHPIHVNRYSSAVSSFYLQKMFRSPFLVKSRLWPEFICKIFFNDLLFLVLA